MVRNIAYNGPPRDVPSLWTCSLYTLQSSCSKAASVWYLPSSLPILSYQHTISISVRIRGPGLDPAVSEAPLARNAPLVPARCGCRPRLFAGSRSSCEHRSVGRQHAGLPPVLVMPSAVEATKERLEPAVER